MNDVIACTSIPHSHSAASRRKAWLLGTASALVIGATVSGPARAVVYPYYPATYSDTLDGQVATGYTNLLAVPVNTDLALSASIVNGVAGTFSGTNSSVTVTANTFAATAGGNVVTNSITGTTLPLPNSAAPAPDGIAVLGDAVNTGVAATSLVANSYFAEELLSSAAGNATVSNNTMAAETVLNNATTVIQGNVPQLYSSNTTYAADPSFPDYSGGISVTNSTFNSTEYPYFAAGSILGTSIQENYDSGEYAGSGAMVTESYVGELIVGAPSTPSYLGGSPAVTGNALDAQFTGNTATTAVTLQAGGAPTFYGNAVLTNGQVNAFDEGPGGNPSAIVKYSYVGIGLFSGGGEDASATLTGSAAVTGNTLSAIAIGNQASGLANSLPTGNILTIAGGLGFSGYASYAGTETQLIDTAPYNQAGAGAVVANTQVNYGAPLSAETKQNGIVGFFESAYDATATLSSNAITAEAIGNEVYNALLAPGLGSPGTGSPLDSSFALSNLQQNFYSPITALQFEAGAGILTGTTVGSTLTADSNAITASALGSSAQNVIDLNSSDLYSPLGGTAAVFNFRPPTSDYLYFEAYGDVMINSLQANGESSPVTAINQLPVTAILAGLGSGVVGSTLSVTNTASAALAEGNAVANTITLTASDIYTSAALLSSQSSYGSVTAELLNPINAIFTGPTNGVLTLTGNLQRAIATGNSADNTLTATGSNIYVASEGYFASAVQYVPGAAFPFDETESMAPSAVAQFVAFNDQATTSPVSAEVSFTVPSLLVGTLGGLLNSSISNSTNTMVAAARGNQATTQLTLAPTNSLSIYLGGGEDIAYAPMASLTNVQTLADGTPVTAFITANGPLPPIYTIVGTGMLGSTLTNTGNQIQTLAQGNNAANALTLSGTATVAEPAGSMPAGLYIPSLTVPTGEDAPPPYTTIYADAAFALNNLQYAGTGTVGAHQSGTGIEDNILGNTYSSTVQIGGDTAPLANIIGSAATANLAANTLILNAANLSASAGITNFQDSEGSTVSTLLGPVGFGIELNGTVSNSTIGINGNQVSSSATANAATNTASSTAAISSSSMVFGVEDYIAFFTGAGAFTDSYYGSVVAADLGLLNSQNVGAGGAVFSAANAVYSIDAEGIAGSAVSISGNTQLSAAAGNQATNSLTLAPGITPPDTTSQTASLLSLQSVSATSGIAAESSMVLSGPLTMANSSLTISGNSNTASAVANDAVNTLTVNGTATLPGFQANDIGYTQAYNNQPAIYGYADYSVFNVQTASGGGVDSVAYLRGGNNDLYASTGGAYYSSATFDSNTLVSQALANSATNSLSVTTDGTSSAIATVGNNQSNSDAVDATATINVVFALGQFTPPVLSGHTTYAVTNNTTQALATGNQASNALNIAPTAYGAPALIPGSNVNTGYGPQISATYSVLNSQYNSGPVTATAYGESPPLELGGIITTGAGQGGYGVALRTTGYANTVNVSGNTVSAQAIGNRATNAVTLVALNTGSASTGINSVQVNNGSVSASVNNVTFGVAATQGTTAHVANNTLAASAFGNVVANSIVTH